MKSLATDLSDGVKLVQLMEIMGNTTLGRFYINPRMRVQKAENVNLALEFIKSRGVVLTNVGAEGGLVIIVSACVTGDTDSAAQILSMATSSSSWV